MKRILFISIFIISLFSFNLKVEAQEYKAVVDITTLSVTEIQDAIDKGYLTYELLIKLYLARIEEYDDTYNAIISINDDAVEQAKECDEIYQESGRTSMLFGIPIIVKDNIDYDGLPTTVGTLALDDSYPDENAEIIQNLVDAGAIILGKANMSEFAFSALLSYSSYGSVKNAYNSLYTTYGSSGGSAVSVALAYSPLAIGTDTASSVRLPSSANNVVGLRPTYGLLSSDGIVAYDYYKDTAGPISKTVEDNAILLTVLADNGIDYTDYLDEDGLNGKTIGVLTQYYEEDSSSSLPLLYSYYDEIEDLMIDAIAAMEDAGATIVYIDDFYSSYNVNIDNNTIMGYTMCYYFNQYIINTSSSIQSYAELLSNGGYVQDLDYYDVSCNVNTSSSKLSTVNSYKEEYREYVEDIMEEYGVDVLVYNNSKNKLLKLSGISNSDLVNGTRTIAPITGFPAITVPLGFDSDGLPYGIEFLALDNQEDLLYEVAYSFEQHTDNTDTPEDAPNLYDISDTLNELISLYENTDINKNNYTEESYNNYLDISNQVEDYLTNYNDYEYDEDFENELLVNYQNAIDDLQESVVSQAKLFLFIIPILLLLIIIKRKF